MFVKPDYTRNNFSLLPALAHSLLGAAPRPAVDLSLPQSHYDRVIVILADAFGWQFVAKARQRHAILSAAQQIRLTAQFPSTTAAHITTWHSGLPVGQHGQLEWQYYDPAADDIISPLPFSYGGQLLRDRLWLHGLRPEDLYIRSSFYLQMQQEDITATILQPAAYTPGTFTSYLCTGATMQPYKTLAHALVYIQRWLQESRPPAYLAFYFPQIDTLCHQYGPNAPETWAEIDLFFHALDSLLLGPRTPGNGKTLILLTADHGQTAVSPKETRYLNTDPAFRALLPLLRRNRRGEYLAPSGSPRDMFLYIQPEKIQEAADILQAGLQSWAEVRRTETLIDEGYFGPTVSPAFRQRVGDLVILPTAHKCVWWYEKGRYEQRFYGHHGGLSADEMEIPLIAWER